MATQGTSGVAIHRLAILTLLVGCSGGEDLTPAEECAANDIVAHAYEACQEAENCYLLDEERDKLYTANKRAIIFCAMAERIIIWGALEEAIDGAGEEEKDAGRGQGDST